MTSKYIKISNTADNVPRIALEKLGLSMKRNDPTTIGQFGSGIKFAPIAAIRRGWDWVFTGKDDQGPYTLRYKPVEESGIQCVEYDYGDYTKSSSFTMEAGSLSWIDPFQIYREAVANAMDGAKISGGVWDVDLVEEIGAPIDGEFSVYITAAPEIMNIHNSFDKYFSVDREVVRTMPGLSAKIFAKGHFGQGLKVYCHDVLVGDFENYKSLYDYNFDTIGLNEERTVRSEWSLRYDVYYTLMNPDEQTAKKIFQAAADGEELFELECIMHCTTDSESSLNRNKWRSVFYDLYGAEAVPVQKSLMSSHGFQLSLRNKVAIPFPDGIAFLLMKRAGIDLVQDILSEEISFDIDYDIEKYPKLTRAMHLCVKAEPAYAKFLDRTFVLRNSDQEVFGLTINMNKSISDRVILIEENHAMLSSLEQIVATIIHEFDHAEHSVKDSSDKSGRDFRDLADRRIGKLVCQHYSDDIVELRDGKIMFDPQYYSEIGKRIQIEYSIALRRLIIKTKSLAFTVKCESYPDESIIIPTFDTDLGKFVLEGIEQPEELRFV